MVKANEFLNEAKFEEKSANPNTFDFNKLQKSRYETIKSILEPLGIKLDNMTYGYRDNTRGGSALLTYKVWSSKMDNKTGKPMFTWHKYEGGNPEGGQNWVIFGDQKYKTTDFLSKLNLQERFADIVKNNDVPKSDLDINFTKHFKITGDYTITKNGIKVDGDCKAKLKGVQKTGQLPFKFTTVTGIFDVTGLNLTTLEGCPKKIKKEFICSNNLLTSMAGAPVAANFNFRNNRITNLNHLGEICDKSLYVYVDLENNPLTSLSGIPNDLKDYELTVTYSEHLPLLWYVRMRFNNGSLIIKDGPRPIIDICNNVDKKYGYRPDPKQAKAAILDFQKSLIDAGFVTNAGF